MTLFRSLAALFALASACAASAQGLPRLANQVIPTGCRQGECSYVRILGLSRAARVPQGELRRVRLVTGSARESERGMRWEPAARDDHVFCSTARPAYAFRSEEGQLITHYLDLHDLGGYQQGSATLYMRLCHNRSLSPRALRALGYRPGTRSEQVEGGAPEDMTRF